MDDKLAAYRQAQGPVPDTYWLWPLYGAGIEALGRDDRPVRTDTPPCGPDQLLVRHDAVGLCFSDTKVIQVGGTHPRLMGRDLNVEPVVLGHEVSMTVMQVGENLRDRFRPGERYIIQADIYYHGVGMAYGYALQGGLSQYNVIGAEVLNGDEGCYLLPVRPETGYAQSALTEPWACVGASYAIAYRAGWLGGGTVLIAARPGAQGEYALGSPYAGGEPPALVVTAGVSGRLAEELAERASRDGFRLVSLPALDEAMAESRRGDRTVAPAQIAADAINAAMKREASGSGEAGASSQAEGLAVDDLVLLDADSALYECLEPLAAHGALINLVGMRALSGMARVDVGRLHYDHIALVGTATTEIAAGYAPIRTEFVPGGRMALLGAAGPMGQMHFQRALQAEVSPHLIVATSRVMDRLSLLPTKFAQLIASRSGQTQVLAIASAGKDPAAFRAQLLNATQGEGYDDIIMLAPSAQVVADAVALAAPGGVVNVFAGLPRGTRAEMDLGAVAARGVRLIGSSGSSIADLRRMLDATEEGRLDPNLSVAAVAGLSAAKEGLRGVMESQFPGKVVIYPQVLDLPLTMLADLNGRLPAVYDKLGPNASWTVEAEAAFLRELLP